MTDNRSSKSAVTIDEKVLLSGISSESVTGKIIQTLQEEEYLVLTNGDGILTGKIGKRSLSHKEGFPHYSVHIWVVNTKAYIDDIGIYICKKAKRKIGGYYQFRTAGGHVGVTRDWKMDGEEKKIRKQMLENTARREVMEELGLVLEKSGKILDRNTGEVLEENSKFRVLINKSPYQSIKEIIVDGEQVTKKNNEHIGIFAFEFNGEITNFEKKEIEKIEIISSKKLIEMLERDGSLFGHKNSKTWKQSNKYKTAIKIIRQLQQEYLI